mmetsp:Transcript_7775/g.25840  ORF Transcript_7775/g.25840 Transcript_7775/m.25840 type:complete len:386 (+) Transcript_7775:241-1398(+)
MRSILWYVSRMAMVSSAAYQRIAWFMGRIPHSVCASCPSSARTCSWTRALMAAAARNSALASAPVPACRRSTATSPGRNSTAAPALRRSATSISCTSSTPSMRTPNWCARASLSRRQSNMSFWHAGSSSARRSVEDWDGGDDGGSSALSASSATSKALLPSAAISNRYTRSSAASWRSVTAPVRDRRTPSQSTASGAPFAIASAIPRIASFHGVPPTSSTSTVASSSRAPSRLSAALPAVVVGSSPTEYLARFPPPSSSPASASRARFFCCCRLDTFGLPSPLPGGACVTPDARNAARFSLRFSSLRALDSSPRPRFPRFRLAAEPAASSSSPDGVPGDSATAGGAGAAAACASSAAIRSSASTTASRTESTDGVATLALRPALT